MKTLAEGLRDEVHRRMNKVTSKIQTTVSGIEYLDVTNGSIGFSIECRTDPDTYGLTQLPSESFGEAPAELYSDRSSLINRLAMAFGVETIAVFEVLVGGDSKGFFSTFVRAHEWKNAYIEEFPVVRKIGWEIQGALVPSDTELDLPMNYKRDH